MGAYRWNNKNVIIVPEGESKCVIPLDSPGKDVTDLECCTFSGNVTNRKYYSPLDIVISPSSVFSYLDICKNFCVNGVNGEECVDSQGEIEYKECINAIKPVNCIGKSIPVGYSGITFYYGYTATKESCPETVPC